MKKRFKRVHFNIKLKNKIRIHQHQHSLIVLLYRKSFQVQPSLSMKVLALKLHTQAH